ncbi:MAG: glycosyltransferase family 4 protein [Pirellulales bacterium]
MNTIVGQSGIHAVHCDKMREDYLTKYPSEALFLFVPPTVVSQKLEAATPYEHRGFTLGCLSNLTIAKGLDLTIATFEELVNLNLKVRLLLAGPCKGKIEKKLIDEAIAKWPDLVEYRGPVYQKEKAQFYADIDAFIFPTRYKVESWGIVLTEALSAGRPVISYDRGCISHIIRGDCGRIISRSTDFVPEAVSLIQQWIESKQLYEVACQQALVRNQELERDAIEQLEDFVQELHDLA